MSQKKETDHPGSEGIYKYLERTAVPFNYGSPIDFKKLNKVIDQACKEDEKRIKELHKEWKNNIKFLSKRSKELGKEVPFEILARLNPYQKIYVSSDFFQKHKEWFNQ